MVLLQYLKVKVKVTQSCLTLCDPHGLYSPWISPGQNTGVDSLSLLQGTFPTQGSNPVQVSRIAGGFFTSWAYRESPRILEWVTYPFYSRFSWPRNQTGSPALQVDSLPTELSGRPSVPKDLHFKTNLSPRNHGAGGHRTTLWELLVLAESSLDSPPPTKNNYLPVTVFLSSPFRFLCFLPLEYPIGSDSPC